MTISTTLVFLLFLYFVDVHTQDVILSNDKCPTIQSPPPAGITSYAYYASVSITSNSSGWLFIGQPATNGISYQYDGVRSTIQQTQGGGICTYCKYDLDPNPDQYWAAFDQPNSSYLQLTQPYNQMYGPCFNGLASTPMPCIQNEIFFPSAIVGYYYYPRQKRVTDGTMDTNTGPNIVDLQNMFRHPYLRDPPALNVPPDNWGLGSTLMKRYIGELIVKNKLNNATDFTASTKQRAPYELDPITHVDYWPGWAQMMCSAGCHRDTMFTQRSFTSSDVLGPLYSALTDQALITNCAVKCPPGQAVYMTDQNNERTYNPRLSTFWSICRPWFGTLPKIILLNGDYVMPFTTTPFNTSLGTLNPTNTDVYTNSQFCPIDTYNRECAQTKLAAKQYNGNKVIECQACPSLYSTNGSTGSWFCLPPPGRIFSSTMTRNILTADGRQGSITNGTQWRYRNLSFFELECGSAGNCYQCSDAICGVGCSPTEFNELIIFGPFFADSACPSGSYCPDAVTVLPCPAAKPYSPAGSISIQGCACSKGKYMNSNGTCVQCTTSCTGGFFLDKTQCQDGATTDAQCWPCTNYDSLTSTLTSPSSSAQANGNVGYCSILCNYGYQVNQTSYLCYKMLPITIAGIIYYTTSITSKQDGYTADIQSSVINSLTFFLSTITDPTTLSLDTVCRVNMTTGVPSYSGTYRGYVPTLCIPCNFQYPPNGSYFSTGGLTVDICSASHAICVNPTTYYMNATAWACQSCAIRQQQVCEPSKTLTGQGCAGIPTPFNLSYPASDCRLCPHTANTQVDGTYLFMPPDAICSIRNCTIPPGSYWPPNGLCVGTSPGTPIVCPTITEPCPANYFITPEKKLLGCGPAPWQCQPCNYGGTAGYYYDSTGNCTATRDIQPQPCPANSYCPGRGPPQPCPDIQISSSSAKSIDWCYCPLGYLTTIQGGMTKCVKMQCPNTTSLGTPGVANSSLYYMSINTNLVTQCTLCTQPPISSNTIRAYAIGTTFLSESCVCPSGYYGRVAGASLDCILCDLNINIPTCGSGLALPASSCNTAAVGFYRTSLQDSIPPFSVSACSVAYPPFSVNQQAGGYTCNNRYQLNPAKTVLVDPAQLGTQNAAGSSLYSTLDTWKNVYMQQADSVCHLNTNSDTGGLLADDFTISKATVSSSTVLLNVNIEPAPYVFWIPTKLNQGHTPTVFASTSSGDITAQCLSGNSPAAQLAHPWSWIIAEESSTGAEYYAQGIAVSAWSTSPFTNVELSLAIAVVVLKNQSNGVASLHLAVAIPSISIYQPQQPPPSLKIANQTQLIDLSMILNPGTVSILDVVASSTYTPASIQLPYGVFFIAYNERGGGGCGVVVAGVSDANTGAVAILGGKQDLCSLPRSGSTTATVTHQSLMGIAVMESSSGGTTLCLLYSDNPTVVYITQASTTAFSPLIEYSYSSNGGLLGGMKGLFPKTSHPMLLSLANGADCVTHAGGLSQNCMLVSDSWQRTFVPLQGLPWGSYPSLIAGVSMLSDTSAVLVVAAGQAIYSIAVNICMPAASYTDPLTSKVTTIPRYWNGMQCAPQMCLQVPPCGLNQFFNGATCICSPGYYKTNSGSCDQCTPPNYCPGLSDQQSYQCQPTSASLQTTVSKATSAMQCLCGQTGSYFDTQKKQCVLCTAGQFCPDKWNMFTCPSHMDTTRIGLSSTTSAGCVCFPGYYGAACLPCPTDKICPAQASTSTLITQGQLFSVNLVGANSVVNAATESALYITVLKLLRPYFISNNQIVNVDDFTAYTYMKLYNSTHTSDLNNVWFLMVTVQLKQSSASWISTLILSSDDRSFRDGTSNIVQGLSALGSTDINTAAKVNIPTSCPAMQTPDPSSYISCLCVAGSYSSSVASINSRVCTLCPVNFFTAVPNIAAVCQACDIVGGFSTLNLVGSTNCTKGSVASASGDSSSSINIAAIAGGGAAGLLLLIGVFTFIFTQATTTAATTAATAAKTKIKKMAV